jgi:hypothetical protein
MPSNLDDQIGRSSTKISQAVDIWSLGCIYSEAAMWIADGYKGVVDYRRQRMAETDKILNFKGGDCFHDGERVLKAVGGAHEDIEHRLRRSDYITKDVLDSMVVEMMWDEDRPNAKAMWRKAEGVLSRAQQRLPSNTEDNFTRSHNYNRSPTYLSPQPPPVQPQAPPPGLHVDAWRKEVSGPSGELVGPNYDEGQTSSMESVTEFGSQLTGSIPGLQGASSSLMTTPITSPFTSPLSSPFNSSFNSPFTSPRVNPQHDVYRRLSNEGQLRTLQNRRSSGQPSDISHRQSHIIATRLSDNRLMAPNELGPRVEFLQEAITMTPTDGEGNSDSFVDDAKTIGQVSRQSSSAYFVPITGQAVQREPPSSSAYFVPITSQAVQREPPSYPYSPDDFPIPPRSEKRPKALPLQPLTSPTSQAPQPPVVKHTAKTSIHHQIPVARYASFSNNPALHVSTHLSGRAHSVEYLSLAEALEWKKAHKKPKKRGRESSLRGADLLDVLKHRDHV